MFGDVVRIGMSVDVKEEEVVIKSQKRGAKPQKRFIGDAVWLLQLCGCR
jgi:hypothetical protein